MKKHLLVLLPWFCMCIGAGLNVLVMTVNHGMMPFVPPASSDWFSMPANSVTDMYHTTWYAGIHLAFLADWIRVSDGVCSIGDLFLWFGEWISPYAIGAWLALVWSERKKQPILTQAYDGVLYDRAARTAQLEPGLRLQ